MPTSHEGIIGLNKFFNDVWNVLCTHGDVNLTTRVGTPGVAITTVIKHKLVYCAALDSWSYNKSNGYYLNTRGGGGKIVTGG